MHVCLLFLMANKRRKKLKLPRREKKKLHQNKSQATVLIIKRLSTAHLIQMKIPSAGKAGMKLDA